MLGLVGNPEDRFSHNEAHLQSMLSDIKGADCASIVDPLLSAPFPDFPSPIIKSGSSTHHVNQTPISSKMIPSSILIIKIIVTFQKWP